MLLNNENSYLCLARKKLVKDNLTLLSVRHRDIDQIRIWRNSQLNFLRQNKKISYLEQEDYYMNNIFNEFETDKPNNIIFSLLKNSKLVGYGGLVHIAWDHLRAEVSFLVDTEISGTKEDYSELFPSFLNLIKDVAFNDLKFNKLTAELFDIRPNYKKALIANDFEVEGVLKNHIFIKKRIRKFYHFWMS